MRYRDRRTLLRALAFLAAFAALAFLAFRLLDRSWHQAYREERETGNQAFMDEGIVSWQGKNYRRKTNVTTILLAGIDRDTKETSASTSRFRSGGQADFLLLLAIDHGEKKIHQLQIDRDTMANVTILGIYGNETGTRVLQICLAHSFGAYPEDNAKYTLRAVSDLLGGEAGLEHYYMVDYSAVPILNDVLGGVTVTIPEDMTSVRPDWERGRTVTLHGSDAEDFVRARQTVGLGTNEERMGRQNVYMTAAIARMKEQLASNRDFGLKLLSALRENAVTNLSEQTLLREIDEARAYPVQPVDTLPGEYLLSEEGYVEFYPEEDSTKSWVMEHLYSPRP